MGEVNVGNFSYPSFNSTNGIAFDLFLTGCSRHCKGCHNPHLWNKNAGIRMEIDEIVNIVKSKKVLDSIAIMGGEPLENEQLPEILYALWSSCPEKEIWLYTSYELEEIPEEIKQYCDYIKTGTFEQDLYIDNARLSSSNQKIFKNEGNGFGLYYVYGEPLHEMCGSKESFRERASVK